MKKIIFLLLASLLVPVSATFAGAPKGAAKHIKIGESGTDQDKKMATHFKFLNQYLPNLKTSDLRNLSQQKLQDYYYDAYRAQGKPIAEARKMASEVQL